MAKQPTCRKCSVCEGASHHWLDNPDFGCDPNDEEGIENTEASHVCKHCDALGMECEACDGSGQTADGTGQSSSEGGEDFRVVLCPACKGEGVIQLPPTQGAER